MKTIGLLGGMSWESTQTYYRLINEGVKSRLGGLHSAKLVLYSVDFAEIEALQHQGDWPATARILSGAALSLENAGADFLMIGTNTMHKVAPEIEEAINIPLLHIADATAKVLTQDNIQRVGLLGTRFTMEQAFYRERLEAAGIEVVTPDAPQRAEVHRVIYEELCQGEIQAPSREAYLAVINSLAEQGAQAVILGCTEIGLLIKQTDTPVPLYDTTAIHAAQAVNQALTGD
ncbi:MULTISPECIES: aspartate/glutamate racemase family protein [Marinobacter]|jgi:aspartate racemase|uniref:aspartate/glutamate racemase family protein n=1 Tax=Marinobacter TaxID=2742 RepID=UPI00056600B5|nr:MULTISPECIES: aspartate/glutamate racemase family protein [Marinobacter]MBJ7277402.1 aspartate/glutamate racemase family protein [Marinobacter salarius]MBJ7299919.1 aspartate/glutamate racemase family protein [Marinobacter salarius]MCZ4285591.1 aspartate/glutamate racemase family protein [Marinobacter salarius]MDC8457066.1 aspartate/glutamate racemase family protein [Marinobacter sp. DS40M6]VVS97046.1 putative racemase [Marinobacter salarius]|tara:strand:+ start:530 stop:1225 length:696 start_codon:yes stop_codon:yes gene_type:complete